MLKILKLVSTAKGLVAGHERDWAAMGAKEDTILENGCGDDSKSFIVLSRPHSIFTEPNSNEELEPLDESWVDDPGSEGGKDLQRRINLFPEHWSDRKQSKSNYAPSKCTVLSCEVCPTLIKVDAEILRANSHGHLVELSKKRRSSENSINDHHDPFTRLPPVLISEIFKFYCRDSSSPVSPNKRPLIIGEVCKYWRDVTLGTPQLWSTIVIQAHVSQPYDIDVIVDWLSRSRSLPLSINITFIDDNFAQTVDLEKITLWPLIHLLRSHSARWNNITVDATCCQSVLFLPLFRDLENSPTNLETFQTHTEIYGADEVLEHDMFPLLLPKKLNTFTGSSTVGLPIGWDRLTSLDVRDSMYFEEFFHIIGHAPNLLHLCVTSVCDVMVDSEFDLSNSVVTSLSITSLDIQSSSEDSDSLLAYLTLPSLKKLYYTDICYHPAFRADSEMLKAFLDRSSPKLDEFFFSITPKQVLPPLLIIGKALENEAILYTDEFLSLVFSKLHAGGLTKFQYVSLIIPSLTPEFWPRFHSLFEPLLPIKYSQSLWTLQTSPPPCRLLRYFDVRWTHHPNEKPPTVSIDPTLLTSFLEIEKESGVKILVGDLKPYPLSQASNVPPQTVAVL